MPNASAFRIKAAEKIDTGPAITFRPYLPGKHPPPAGPRAKTLRAVKLVPVERRPAAARA